MSRVLRGAPRTRVGTVSRAFARGCASRALLLPFILRLPGARESTNGAISAKSQIQKLVAMSSMEAELIALCAAALAAVFIRNILAGFRKPQQPTVIYEDNNAAAIVAQSAVIQRRARHIDLRYFKVRELVSTGQVSIKRINSADNCADVFTKNVGPQILNRHLPMLLGSDQRSISAKLAQKHYHPG